MKALQAQRQIVAGPIRAHQVLHDAVELSSARSIGAGHAKRRHDALVEEPCKGVLVGCVEQRHPGYQLGRGGVCHQVVGDADAIDETAFRQATLVETRPQLQRRHDDVAPHRLAVDDRPARPADVLEEELSERDQIVDEEVGLILARAIARRDPCVTFGSDVARDRRRGDCARPRAALDAVREHDETAAPVLRHGDEILRAAEHAAPADRRALCLGTRYDERQDQREQHDEPHGFLPGNS